MTNALPSGPATVPGDCDVLLIEDLAQQRLPARMLAAVLGRAGLRARLAHLPPAEEAGAVVALAERLRPRLVVLSILFADRVAEHLALASALRRAGVAAHCTAVGPLPSLAWAELLTACPALDSVLCGEAEASVVALATGLPDPERWQATAGLAYRGPALRANPLPAPIACLDDLPFPLRDPALAAGFDYGFATVEASRGCYHGCTFCLPRVFQRGAGAPAYRLCSIGHLVDEIEALYREGTRLFLFDDEQFLAPEPLRAERVEALARELARRRLRIAFTLKCRADDVEAALFRRLRATGLLRVYAGIESGCLATLDLLGKGVTARRNAEALAQLDALGIVADFRSLLFHPWSTLATVESDLDFLGGVLPSVATCFSFREVQVYPGTPLAARLRREGRGGGDPWPIAYTLADPRAELLRRLGHLIFGQTGVEPQVTQAWFALLLRRRFRPWTYEPRQARRLRAIVQEANAGALAVWREMLEFVGTGDIYDAAQVNERAARWARRVRLMNIAAEERLADLQARVTSCTCQPPSGQRQVAR